MLPSLILSFFYLSLAGFAGAATVTYTWDVTWVWANPDGQFWRPVIGINGTWPCPPMEATLGDTVVVNLHNSLGNQSTGMHFHGINQVQTPEMDGPSGVTQCPLPPGSTIKYQFKADSPGTFWYHSHNMGQYPDGLRGTFIVHDPNDPNKGSYDEEVILTVSDWYHLDSVTTVKNMLVQSNTHFIPPFPDSIIVNEGRGSRIPFIKGKTYRIRIINFSAFASAMIHFDSHTMTVLSTDSAYIQKQEAYQLRVAPAQRYDVLISAIDRDNYNFPFLVSLDINRDWTNPASVPPLAWPHNYTGYLVLDQSLPLDRLDVVDEWRPFDDSHFKALDGAPTDSQYDKLIHLDFNFGLDQNGYPRAYFNNITYITQKVPTLYTAATTGDFNTNPVIYGQVNPFIVTYGDLVQIVVNNLDAAAHPFHLHGHHFQVLDRPRSGTGSWPYRDVNYASTPVQRDTVTVMANSFAVLRFRATNPGTWLFHCHIEWHVEMGLTATIIEAPECLAGLTFPADHIAACQKAGIPYRGNAAGNTQNPLDQTGFITVPPVAYTGANYVAPANVPRRHLAPK